MSEVRLYRWMDSSTDAVVNKNVPQLIIPKRESDCRVPCKSCPLSILILVQVRTHTNPFDQCHATVRSTESKTRPDTSVTTGK